MNCPKCDGAETEVSDSRRAVQYVRRRRQCPCGYRFSTVEIAVDGGGKQRLPLVRKLMSEPPERLNLVMRLAAFIESEVNKRRHEQLKPLNEPLNEQVFRLRYQRDREHAAAQRMAASITIAIDAGIIDSRSLAGDALLDYLGDSHPMDRARAFDIAECRVRPDFDDPLL